MSQLEQKLREAILADPAVAALIGSRLYLIQIPQNPVFPCVAFHRIYTSRLYAHAIGQRQASMGYARYQFDIFGATKNGAAGTLEVAEAIKAALQTFNLAEQPQSPEVLRGAPNYLLNEFMRIEPDISPQPVYVTVLDTRIWFQELT